MALRDVRHLVRKKSTTGGNVPSGALMGEPFVNLYDGILKFSGATGGGFEISAQSGVFEVGSKLYNQTITNRLNINSNFIISGDTGYISTYAGTTALAGKFLSGTTNGFVLGDISDIIGSDTTRVQGGTNISTGGTASVPIINLDDDITLDSVSATTISASTLYSGTTDLSLIFQPIGGDPDHTRVQGGTNISTGGTASVPIINLDDDITLNSVSATTISASTLYSGTTDLSNLFQLKGEDIYTRVQNGLNTYTGGTAIAPTVNVSGLTIDNITVSGESSFQALSATTFYSGSTDLSDIFALAGEVGDVTRVQGGININTGGTDNYPIINLDNDISIQSITASGASVFTSTIDLQGTILNSAGDITVADNFIPSASSIYNLGAPANKWSNIYADVISLTSVTITSLTAGRVVYVGASQELKDEAGFEYNDGTNTLLAENISTDAAGNLVVGTGGAVIGAGGSPGTPGNGDLTVHGSLTVFGEVFSAHTSELYIEDNLIELNYNPTADTSATSLGSGFAVQDGAGTQGTDVFWDIRGSATGVANRAFTTNLNDIRIRESGTTSSPNGVRVLAELDVLDGGTF